MDLDIIDLPKAAIQGAIAEYDRNQDSAVLEQQNDRGQTLLSIAIRLREGELVSALLKRGAKVNVIDNHGEASLHHAVHSCSISIVSMLLAYTEEVNIVNENQETPLHLAVQARLKEITLLLLEKGAKSDLQDILGDTPLHRAVVLRFIEIVNILLEKGVPITVNMKNNAKYTPLHSAILGRNEQIADLLLEHGASLKIRDGAGNIPLHLALYISETDNSVPLYPIVKLLLAKGSKTNVKNVINETPLHHAAHYGNKAVVGQLLAYGAVVHIKSDAGTTPLSAAFDNVNLSSIALLLTHGAALDTKLKEKIKKNCSKSTRSSPISEREKNFCTMALLSGFNHTQMELTLSAPIAERYERILQGLYAWVGVSTFLEQDKSQKESWNTIAPFILEAIPHVIRWAHRIEAKKKILEDSHKISSIPTNNAKNAVNSINTSKVFLFLSRWRKPIQNGSSSHLVHLFDDKDDELLASLLLTLPDELQLDIDDSILMQVVVDIILEEVKSMQLAKKEQLVLTQAIQFLWSERSSNRHKARFNNCYAQFLAQDWQKPFTLQVPKQRVTIQSLSN